MSVSKRKLNDFFMFGFPSEADVLYLKLVEQYPYFERFFILETDRTHQNQPKPYYLEDVLEEARFKPFLPKIIYERVPANDLNFISVRFDTDRQGLFNENAQRDYLFSKYRKRLALDDLIYVSDCDEILSGEDIPKIIEVFERNPSLSICQIPLLRTIYDYNNVDEERGFWPTFMLTRRCLDKLFGGSLSKVRDGVRCQSIASFVRPSRYRGKKWDEILYPPKRVLSKVCRMLGFKCSSPRNPISEPRNAGYFGWHFSYSYRNPIEQFYKLMAVCHSQCGDPSYFPYHLDIMKQNRGVTLPGQPLKPVCKQWPLEHGLFPDEIVQSPSSYLINFVEKIQSVTIDEIMLELGISAEENSSGFATPDLNKVIPGVKGKHS